MLNFFKIVCVLIAYTSCFSAPQFNHFQSGEATKKIQSLLEKSHNQLIDKKTQEFDVATLKVSPKAIYAPLSKISPSRLSVSYKKAILALRKKTGTDQLPPLKFNEKTSIYNKESAKKAVIGPDAEAIILLEGHEEVILALLAGASTFPVLITEDHRGKTREAFWNNLSDEGKVYLLDENKKITFPPSTFYDLPNDPLLRAIEESFAYVLIKGDKNPYFIETFADNPAGVIDTNAATPFLLEKTKHYLLDMKLKKDLFTTDFDLIPSEEAIEEIREKLKKAWMDQKFYDDKGIFVINKKTKYDEISYENLANVRGPTKMKKISIKFSE